MRSRCRATAAPIGSLGNYRLGEDGRLYLIAKSEHYHTPLGHAFPGYQLVENAARLGIPNATHNNTRGGITRFLEAEIVRAANGIARDDSAALAAVLASKAQGALNRIINLETGSLATEAALKMMLARFYRLDATSAKPVHAGRVPVFLVMAAQVAHQALARDMIGQRDGAGGAAFDKAAGRA